MILLSGCSREDKIFFPKADTFYIKAVIPSSYGEYVFNAVITEEYTEFTSENLKNPIRFENGLISCEEINAEINPNQYSLFCLSELFSKIFSGENTFEYYKDGVNIIFITEIDGRTIKIKADAETLMPSAIFSEDTTVAITEITLN